MGTGDLGSKPPVCSDTACRAAVHSKRANHPHMLCLRKAHFVFAHNFDVCQLIFIISDRGTLKEICKKAMYINHLTCIV